MKTIIMLCTITLLGVLLVVLAVSCNLKDTPIPSEHAPTPTPTSAPSPASTEISIQESPFRGMFGKKVIIRNDDVGMDIDAALRWLSDLVVSKDIKATYSIIPLMLSDRPETVAYLNNLDKKHFEMATHGYAHAETERLGEMTYNEQYSLIKSGTELMEEYLNGRPYTFVPPYSSDNISTTEVCRDLGYHSISTLQKYPSSHIADFAMIDFKWEIAWSPITYSDYEAFNKAFDDFYFRGKSKSQDQFYAINLHSRNWCLENEGQYQVLKHDFEKSIDYMKSKDVEFMTIEEAYQWYVDEFRIIVGKTNDSAYFIDLSACQYNHTVSFHLPPDWDTNIIIKDISTGEETQIYKEIIEFAGVREHYYEIISTFR